jgi:hypothetical protein
VDALSKDLDGFGQVLQPFADALAAMNDADADYVMDNCLTAVQRQQPTGWARVVSLEQKTHVPGHGHERDPAAGRAGHRGEPRAFYSRVAYQPSEQPGIGGTAG